MNNELFPETMLVKLDHGHSFTTSIKVAEHFGKRHTHVLRAIENLLADIGEQAFSEPNFGLATYLDAQKKPRQMYRLSRDGFALIAMGFTGKEALVWKIKFLDAFNAMEAELQARTARYAAALDQVRPNLRPVVEGTQSGLNRAAIAGPLGKSCASVSYHRSSARRLGLLGLKPAPAKTPSNHQG